MKKILQNIGNKLIIKSDRTKHITTHVFWSFLYKGGSILTNFLLVPITINYLDTENYGVWLTLSSFISWFSFFDLGLGNGLRNKFAEAKAMGNYNDAQAYVSTAYFTVGSFSLSIVIVFLIVNQFINWTYVFNTDISLKSEMSTLIPVVFAFFSLQLVLRLITSIYQADQNHSIQGKIQFLGQVLSLIVIWILTKTNQSSLLIFGSVFSALPVFILVGLNIFAFKKTFIVFKPKLSLWKRKYIKEISGLGFKFFIIQIAGIVLFSTDNFIISRLFLPEDVVPYNVAFKYFSLITMGYTIIITPYWSSFTEAYAKKDFEWIKKSIDNIQKIWLLIPFCLIVMVMFADRFYQFWVGERINVPIGLSVSMALYVALLTYNMIYASFINGIGKIKLNLIFSIISMFINIPLSIYFGKYLGLGPSGVALATCFCLLYALPFLPIQYNKLISGQATGIWNK